MVTKKKKSNTYSGGGRVRANVSKSGITRNGKRRYSCGGKLKTKQYKA